MLSSKPHPQTTLRKSIPKITGNTKISSLVRYFGIEDELMEHMELFFGVPPEMSEEVFGDSHGDITSLMNFLKRFPEAKYCGMLHERIDILDRRTTSSRMCQMKFSNPCCGHPEQNGLAKALMLGEYILILIHDRALPTVPTSVKMLNPVIEIDTDVDRRSSRSQRVQFFTRDQVDLIRQDAIERQAIEGEKIIRYIGMIISGLESLIAETTSQQTSSQPPEKPLPQVQLARIL